MPFSATASITSTDMNNNLRGLYRDNADHSVTGTLTETDLASTSVTANTIGATGCIYVFAAGATAGAAGNRTVRLYLGATQISGIVVTGANNEWTIEAWIFNTATNTQRIVSKGAFWVGGTGTPTFGYDYITAAIDTTANQTVKTTGQLANAADTITNTMYDILVAQIT